MAANIDQQVPQDQSIYPKMTNTFRVGFRKWIVARVRVEHL